MQGIQHPKIPGTFANQGHHLPLYFYKLNPKHTLSSKCVACVVPTLESIARVKHAKVSASSDVICDSKARSTELWPTLTQTG